MDWEVWLKILIQPQVLVLPVLMQLDQFMTIVTARMYARRRGAEPDEDYELNPLFQKEVKQRRLSLGLKHVFLVIVYTAVLCVGWKFDVRIGEFLTGASIGYFGVAVAGHLSNIRILKYLEAWPTETSGETRYAPTATLAISQARLIEPLVPLTLIAAFTQNFYVIGGAFGVWKLILVHHHWYQRSVAHGGSVIKDLPGKPDTRPSANAASGPTPAQRQVGPPPAPEIH